MEVGEAVLSLAVVGLLAEAIVDTLKPFWDKTKREDLGDRIAALLVGEAAAILGGFDLFAAFGVPLSNLAIAGPWPAWILTGILLSRGAGFVHSLIEGAAGLAKRKLNPA
jgi:hypothetical protein